MASIVMLDEDNISKFARLFPGDITESINANTICYGAVEENADGRLVPAGLLISEYNRGSFLITWMYVDVNFRDRGIMYSLMNRFIENARNSKLVHNIYCTVTDEDLAAYLLIQFGFYYNGFGDGDVCYSTLGSLEDLSGILKADLSGKLKYNSQVKRLKDFDSNMITQLNKFLRVHDDVNVGVALPIVPEDYMEQSVAIEVKDDIKAFVLLKEEKGTIVVSYAFAKEGYGQLLAPVLAKIQQELGSYPDDTKIVAAALNGNSKKMFKRLFKEVNVKKMYECSYSL